MNNGHSSPKGVTQYYFKDISVWNLILKRRIIWNQNLFVIEVFFVFGLSCLNDHASIGYLEVLILQSVDLGLCYSRSIWVLARRAEWGKILRNNLYWLFWNEDWSNYYSINFRLIGLTFQLTVLLARSVLWIFKQLRTLETFVGALHLAKLKRNAEIDFFCFEFKSLQ